MLTKIKRERVYYSLGVRKKNNRPKNRRPKNQRGDPWKIDLTKGPPSDFPTVPPLVLFLGRLFLFGTVFFSDAQTVIYPERNRYNRPPPHPKTIREPWHWYGEKPEDNDNLIANRSSKDDPYFSEVIFQCKIVLLCRLLFESRKFSCLHFCL